MPPKNPFGLRTDYGTPTGAFAPTRVAPVAFGLTTRTDTDTLRLP